MHRVITGATGLIGKRLVELWLKQGHTITVVGRSEEQIKKIFDTRVQAVSWDRLTSEMLQSAEVVVNLAGTNVGEKRWNAARKQEILNSRVDTTKKIASLLAELGTHSPALFTASAVGIYGLQEQFPDKLPAPLNEDTSIDWNNPPDFLSTVARRWEQAATPAVEKGVHVVFLRFGVVLAKEGGALPKLAQSFQYYLGGPIGTGNQPFCWVAIDDVISAINFLVSKPDVSGPFNIVAPECVSQRTFAQILGKLMDRPVLVKMPAFSLKLIFGTEMANELLLEGQHAYPERLIQLGFRFSYPDIESALNRIL